LSHLRPNSEQKKHSCRIAEFWLTRKVHSASEKHA
jgi:hypothetical protein